MLINHNDMLYKALKHGYAVPTYIVNDLKYVKNILKASNEDKSPVILSINLSDVSNLGGYKTIYDFIKSIINEFNISIPLCLQLNNVISLEQCKLAINYGFTSFMLNLSNKDTFDNSINNIINYAKQKNINIEVKLINLTDSKFNKISADDILNFILETQIDSLALNIKNFQEFSNQTSKIDFEYLGLICKATKTPIALFDLLMFDDNKIKTAIFCGVSKIYINTNH